MRKWRRKPRRTKTRIFARKDDYVNEAEEIVKEALVTMKKAGKIVDFIHSRRNGELDEKGIDFLVMLNNDKLLAIQVKTSSGETNNKRKLEIHLKKHPKIKSVIFVEIGSYKKDSEKVLSAVRKEIEDFMNSV